jgi:cell division protein FtsW
MPRAAAAATRAKAQQPLEYNLLLTVTLCLLAAGTVMVYSASSARTVLQGQGDGTAYLMRYVASAVVGLVLLFVLSRRGLPLIPRLTGPLLLVAFGLLVLVRLPGIGVSVNGGQRWLGAGPLQFQPSELMKLALILYSARLLTERPKCVRRPKELVPIVVVTGSACLLIASQPDLGTAMVIALTLCALLVAAGVPLRTIGAGLLVGFVFVALFALAEPYAGARLTSFLDPWSHAGTTGFQLVQGQIAIGSGGLFGRGLGQSVQKIFYLPEAHTDFILAIIGEELGVVGVMGVLALYGMLAYAGLRVAKRAVGRYAKLVAVGITSMIICQAALNVFAVLGLAPLTGVPLPFISYGASNLVVLLAGMGVMLNIASTQGQQLRLVTGSRTHEGADRSRRDSGARRARPGGRRHAAG